MLREFRLIVFDNVELRQALDLADLKLHQLPKGTITSVKIINSTMPYLDLEIAGQKEEFPVAAAAECMAQHCINSGIPLAKHLKKRLLMSHGQLALELRG